MILRKALCCTCSLIAGILPLAGQSDPGGSTEKSARSAWFACISIPDGVENPVKVLSGKELTALELSKFMTSGPVKIPTDGIIRLIREEPEPANPVKVKQLVLAEARVPENVREALIILAPLPKPEGDLIFRAKVQDLADFKGGDRLYINLSDSPIRVRLGDTQVTVAPGRANIYEAPVLAKPANMAIMSEFYHSEEKKWKILSASTIVVRPTRREICIFNSGSRPGNIKNHKILFPVQMESP